MTTVIIHALRAAAWMAPHAGLAAYHRAAFFIRAGAGSRSPKSKAARPDQGKPRGSVAKVEWCTSEIGRPRCPARCRPHHTPATDRRSADA